ncbi:MAG: M10 family metallopeptidase C-terminal domain-containing protein, partial [Hyphomicrobium sp.]
PPETRDWTVGNFYFAYWMLHEVGHTLGFSHSGSYPGPLYNGLNYLQENNVYTVMSYNSNGDAEVTWTADAGTPMVNDVAAIHYYYGADMTTRTGDTVYGFNSNITDRLSLNFDDMMAQEGKVAPVTIWDAGGSDTLDLSKYIQDAQIDLTEGGYSNAGGQEMSIGIAYGAVVENAIGGYGDDIVFGNTTGNTLRGNDGNDRIYGNTDLAPVVIANPRDFIGVEMNLGTVARNQYLAATGITALSGSQFTFEQMVKLAGAPSSLTAFASYNVSGNDNQFLLEGSGTLKLTIANAAAYDTGVLMASLLDGEPHRLSLTWDKSTGAVGLYIDGAVAHAGIYTAAIGANIKTGGTLVFGQEQDATAGGFDTAQVFQGVLGDLRLFNVSRTEGEISNSAFVALTGAEQGLVHNWQVKTGDTAAVTDVAVVNPAVDLTSLLPANTFTLTQSSSYDQSSGPANVFDNSTATFNHTLNGGNEWLQMNFDQPLAVSFVQIINRPSWGDRLNGATVSLLDGGGNVISTSVAISGAGSGQTINISLAQETTASAVRINQITNFLHIAELNVFGTPPEGVVVDPALINTDLAIVNGATVRSTAPPVLGPDNDTIIGGRGSDQLFGGAGNDY